MKVKIFVLITATMLAQNLFAQQKNLPIIKANSIMVDIKDDDVLEKEAWRIVPEEELDVYTTSARKVTFYTDIDSISFDVNPKVETYDFIILLNGKDTARTQIKWEPSRLEILRGAEKYDYSDNRFIPEFTYQSEDNPNLQKIRQELNLDSIAEKGSELSQIFNLLHWIHYLIRHDGNSYNPDSKNAIDLIQVCKTENRGVNCRMMAMILNECYLAMGIKSRYVTCMPKETQFNDCHVINMVFSKDLNKWIWIDPTFGAYVMDEKGNLLGLQEVRERLITGQPLIINADANWNRESLQTKEHYLDYYMAKNLYWLQCPVNSRFNPESPYRNNANQYISLTPADFDGFGGAGIITHDPAYFWQKPE